VKNGKTTFQNVSATELAMIVISLVFTQKIVKKNSRNMMIDLVANEALR
jgi:hypothetical protein